MFCTKLIVIGRIQNAPFSLFEKYNANKYVKMLLKMLKLLKCLRIKKRTRRVALSCPVIQFYGSFLKHRFGVCFVQ